MAGTRVGHGMAREWDMETMVKLRHVVGHSMPRTRMGHGKRGPRMGYGGCEEATALVGHVWDTGSTVWPGHVWDMAWTTYGTGGACVTHVGHGMARTRVDHTAWPGHVWDMAWTTYGTGVHTWGTTWPGHV